MNSRDKGARGEREWASQLRGAGFDARRGQQFSGSPDSPDVVCDDLSAFHCEVKRVQRLNIQNAIEQASDECGGKIPYVAHRKNHCDWLVTMKAEDWFKLIREYI